jgi:hypothetical protein
LLEKLPADEREFLIARFKEGDKSVAADFTSCLHDLPFFEKVVVEFENQLAKATGAVAPFAELPP